MWIDRFRYILFFHFPYISQFTKLCDLTRKNEKKKTRGKKQQNTHFEKKKNKIEDESVMCLLTHIAKIDKPVSKCAILQWKLKKKKKNRRKV